MGPGGSWNCKRGPVFGILDETSTVFFRKMPSTTRLANIGKPSGTLVLFVKISRMRSAESQQVFSLIYLYVFRGLHWLTLATMSMLSKCCSAARILILVCSLACESWSNLFLWEASGQPAMQNASFQQWLNCSNCGLNTTDGVPSHAAVQDLTADREGQRGTLAAIDAQASSCHPVKISPVWSVITSPNRSSPLKIAALANVRKTRFNGNSFDRCLSLVACFAASACMTRCPRPARQISRVGILSN